MWLLGSILIVCGGLLALFAGPCFWLLKRRWPYRNERLQCRVVGYTIGVVGFVILLMAALLTGGEW